MPLLLILFHSSIYSSLQMGSNAFVVQQTMNPFDLQHRSTYLFVACVCSSQSPSELSFVWPIFILIYPVPNYCSRLSPQLNYNTHWYAGITYCYDHPLLNYGKGEFIFAEQNTFKCIFYPWINTDLITQIIILCIGLSIIKTHQHNRVGISQRLLCQIFSENNSFARYFTITLWHTIGMNVRKHWISYFRLHQFKLQRVVSPLFFQSSKSRMIRQI